MLPFQVKKGGGVKNGGKCMELNKKGIISLA
jgi:hypothetical protein